MLFGKFSFLDITVRIVWGGEEGKWDRGTRSSWSSMSLRNHTHIGRAEAGTAGCHDTHAALEPLGTRSCVLDAGNSS